MQVGRGKVHQEGGGLSQVCWRLPPGGDESYCHLEGRGLQGGWGIGGQSGGSTPSSVFRSEKKG